MESPPRVLIVDDSPLNIDIIQTRLAADGYEILTAADGEAALVLAREHKPDLILLDVMMPKVDGFEVCRRLKTDSSFPFTPIILVTARTESRDVVTGLEAGADEYLTKPLDLSALVSRVRSMLRIKELHDKLQSQNIKLEAQAAGLAKWNKELEAKLSQEVKLAEVARSLGDITHDIKNMVMPILSGAWLLQDELDEHFANLPKSQDIKAKNSQELSKEIIDMVGNNARRIQTQVSDIADCVKGLSGPLNFSTCELVKVVNEAIETLRVLGKEKGIGLLYEGLEKLPPIHADANRLFKVFFNLINNAIPEVPAGGAITVQGHPYTGDNWVDLSVVDTGRGMTQEVRESLFTQKAISTKVGGTGLGTKIVKDIVEAHGGSITVVSEEGKGTSFHIHLPVAGATCPPRS